MDGRIGRLHNRYRITGPGEPPAQVAARLDRLARERLPDDLAEAFDRALGEDPAVYVVRRLDVRLALHLADDTSDGRVAANWARGLARALVRAVAGRAAGTDVVRFDDRADYVARFLTDLVGGGAWDHWYYHPFEAYRARPSLSETIRDILLDHGDDLPHILAHLRRAGSLGRVLAVLEPVALRRVWLRLQGVEVASPHEEARPLLALAVRLLVRLDLWAGPPAEIDLLWAAYAATGPPAADWRDRRSLTAALLAALRFLASRGVVQPVGPRREEILSIPLRGELAELDWLDLDALLLALAEWIAPGSSPSAERLAAGPPLPSGPTPRQADLIGDLLAVIRQGGIVLDRSRPDDAANALALFAALVAYAPRWAGDPLAPALIERLLSAWAWLARGGTARGETDAVLALLPEGARPAAAAPLEELARLGREASAVVASLAAGPSASAGWDPAERLVETGAAGVLFLLRAIQDLRLPALVAAANRDSPRTPLRLDPLLLSLGFQWAGPAGMREGRFDPVLAVLAGLEETPEPGAVGEALGDVAREVRTRFEAALVRQLAGLRLLGDDPPHVYVFDRKGEAQTLVVGHAPTGLWPLGRVVRGADEAGAALADWRDLWEKATGHRPGFGLAGESAAPREEHQAGEEALGAAFSALGHGWLGRPAADLLTTLTAAVVLRVWARWLRRFERSTCPYLLTHFLRRPGRFLVRREEVLVEYEPRPLDVVLEMSGYLEELEQVSWLGGRRVRFRPL
jgi:hypothetical protein